MTVDKLPILTYVITMHVTLCIQSIPVTVDELPIITYVIAMRVTLCIQTIPMLVDELRILTYATVKCVMRLQIVLHTAHRRISVTGDELPKTT